MEPREQTRTRTVFDSASPCSSLADAFLTRPVRIIVGFPAGGTSDIVGRLLGQWLSERLGQQFVVENRPGASANLATEAVAKAAADGYTLLLIGGVNTINATLFDKLSFDFLRDIAPVASVFETPLVVEVNPSVPVHTISEFIAYAKANPGKINLATPGIGTPPHVAGELFKMMAGVDMVHVPYRGTGPMLTDLIGGQVQVAFDPLPASIEHIRAGKLRVLAVTTASRSEALPGIPSASEPFPATLRATGMASPPSEIVGKLNAEINAALADPKMKARLSELGGTAVTHRWDSTHSRAVHRPAVRRRRPGSRRSARPPWLASRRSQLPRSQPQLEQREFSSSESP
jgi:tripartite-type tricarboxylate transporter receptor subunit TctC